jgi:hypothetical protein
MQSCGGHSTLFADGVITRRANTQLEFNES